MSSTYEHTQGGPLAGLFGALSGGAALAALFVAEPQVRVVFASLAVVFGFLVANLVHLRVRDRGDFLDVRFGPLGWMGRKVRYADVRAVRVARSSVLDGWGVHWRPGRGWIFNLWGFDCVELTLAKGRVRIGTDDPRGLARFVAERAGVPLA